MKQRILYLDVIRVMACVMIVLMHSPMPVQGDASVVMRLYLVYNGYITMPFLCLFFAVSGALLLPTHIQPDQSGDWVKMRLKKVIAPTLFWTVVYLVVKWQEGMQVKDLIQSICSVPFSAQGHGVLWFMYTLIGLYIIAPVISPWLEKCGEKTLRLYLGLWAITLCYPILSKFVGVNTSDTGILYYLTGYVGYFVLGYYLRNYGDKIKTWWTVVLFVVALPLPGIAKVLGWDVDFYSVFWYLRVTALMMLLFWWKAGLAIARWFESSLSRKFCQSEQSSSANRLKSGVATLSNLSFGIYLSHILIMRTFLWPWLECFDNWWLQNVLSFGLTLVCATILSYIISLLPFGDYVIGYKRRK